MLTRTTTPLDAGDKGRANMSDAQSIKNARTPHFPQQRVECDSLGASVATIVENSGPTRAIGYQATKAINYVITTVASAVCMHACVHACDGDGAVWVYENNGWDDCQPRAGCRSGHPSPSPSKHYVYMSMSLALPFSGSQALSTS